MHANLCLSSMLAPFELHHHHLCQLQSQFRSEDQTHRLSPVAFDQNGEPSGLEHTKLPQKYRMNSERD